MSERAKEGKDRYDESMKRLHRDAPIVVRQRVLWKGRSEKYHLSQICAPADAEPKRMDDDRFNKLSDKGLLCKSCCYGYDPDY